MRKLIAGPAIFATIAVISGCTSLYSSSSPPVAPDMSLVRQTVKIYDVMPEYGTPIEQISASICDGTPEMATNRLIDITLQRGGNGLMQLACRTEGISFSCWKTATCTGTAINVAPPPPPPPPPPKRAKKKKKT